MMFCKSTSLLEIIDRQLERLHEELGAIYWEEGNSNPEYLELLRQIDQLSKVLIKLSEQGDK